MKIPIDVFPHTTIDQYNLHQQAHNGFIYLEVRKAIYGLPQAGVLANQLLRKRLRPFGYGTTRLHTHLASGNTSHDPFNSPSQSMTLASNTMTKHMRTTSLTPSEHTTHSRKIGTGHYTAEYAKLR